MPHKCLYSAYAGYKKQKAFKPIDLKAIYCLVAGARFEPTTLLTQIKMRVKMRVGYLFEILNFK